MVQRYPIASGSGAAGDIPDSPDDIGAAPAEHDHAQVDVTGLAAALSGKSDASHTHANLATDSELTTGLAGKANSTHTHVMADVTDLAAVLDDFEARIAALEVPE